MKVKMKMKNRSHRCDINRPSSRHEHKPSKYLKVFRYGDAYMYQATPKQHFNLNS